jgi:hypothetical protein
MNELRYAFRQLRKTPSFTLVAIATLALAIGANTALFSVVNAVLLKPLPFPNPEQLVAVGSADTRDSREPGTAGLISFPDFSDFRAQNTTLSQIAAYRERSFALGGVGEAQSLRGAVVSSGLFEALGVQPKIGRTFQREEERSGGGAGGYTAIISHGLWQQQFKGASDVIGTVVNLDGRPHTIVGVMPAGFQFPIQADPNDVYVSTGYDATREGGEDLPMTEQRGNHSYQAIARLKPGVPLERAAAELRTIAAALEKQHPDTNTNKTAPNST